MSIIQEIKDVARFEQILNVLFKHELGYFIEQLRLKGHLSLHKRLARHKFVKKDTRPEHVRLVLEDLGATFVKLGQLLSLRPDLIPLDYCNEFRLLQDQVKPFPSKIAKEIIEEDLQRPIKQMFKHFEENPVASASVAQVHIATLMNGEKVAIKVQRPGIKKVFKTDIDIMYHLAALFEKKLSTNIVNPVEIVEEFDRYTEGELDFVHEAKNIDQFYKNFYGNKNVKIPRVYWAYTTSRVLAMEYIDGMRLREISDLKQYNKKIIVKNIVDSVFKQIFDDGLFHADPHAGNILVLKGNRIAFIDFGIVGRLGDELRISMSNLTFAIVEGDLRKIAQELLNLGFAHADVNLGLFEQDIREGLEQYYGTPIQQLNFSEVLHKIMEIARKNKLKLPTNFVLLIKSLVTLEGVAAELDPSFNVVESVRPMIKKTIRKKFFDKKNISRQAILVSTEYLNLIKTLPKNVIQMIKKLSEGKFTVEMEDTNIKKLTLEIDRSSNRISYGMIIAACSPSCFWPCSSYSLLYHSPNNWLCCFL